MKEVKIIFVCDGETDYTFFRKALKEDGELSGLPIKMIQPEEVGLKVREGGGHKTLLKFAGLAVYKAAQGHAEGVFVSVDNDGDPRFRFPHDSFCNNCRECEALQELNKIPWGKSLVKEASILYQALETLLLSIQENFTPQLEKSLSGKNLKNNLYARGQTFKQILEEVDFTKIKARTYPYLKRKLKKLTSR